MTSPTGHPERWIVPYRIETARLNLCALGPEHVDLMQAVVPRNKPRLSATMPWVQDEPLSYEDRVELLRRMRGNFDLGVDFVLGLLSGEPGTLYRLYRSQTGTLIMPTGTLGPSHGAVPYRGLQPATASNGTHVLIAWRGQNGGRATVLDPNAGQVVAESDVFHPINVVWDGFNWLSLRNPPVSPGYGGSRLLFDRLDTGLHRLDTESSRLDS